MPDENFRLLETNLAALAPHDAALAQSIRAATPDPRLTSVFARNGQAVPVVRLPRGTLPLHSLYDPGRESRRLVESLRGSGCYVLFGLGAGCHAAALLEDPDVFSLLVIEKDAAVLRGLLERVPLASLLSDTRMRLVAGRKGIPTALRSIWQPALMGGLRTVSLRPWCECEHGFFASAADDVQAGIASIRADYSVQAHFGRRWTSNILANMARAEASSPPLPRGARAFVTAAGPSLDNQIEGIRGERSSTLLVATDTSLPALLRSGLPPDAVVSIDCQNHSYQHFLLGIPDQTVLFCDLASPACVTRRARAVSFMASSHPLASWLRQRWMRIPRVDMSGGSVTHAALYVAESLGAARITLCGADFSYPRGSMYARGTYVHDLFSASHGRLDPVESRWCSFLFRSPDTRREMHEGRSLYTTPLLSSYRERLLRLMETMEAEVVPDRGEGLSLAYTRAPREARSSVSLASPAPFGQVSHAKRMCGWREALDTYARSLRELSPPSSGAGAWFTSLSASSSETLATLLPVTAVIRGESGEEPGAGSAIEEARQWTLGRVLRQIDAGGDEGHP